MLECAQQELVHQIWARLGLADIVWGGVEVAELVGASAGMGFAGLGLAGLSSFRFATAGVCSLELGYVCLRSTVFDRVGFGYDKLDLVPLGFARLDLSSFALVTLVSARLYRLAWAWFGWIGLSWLGWAWLARGFWTWLG